MNIVQYYLRNGMRTANQVLLAGAASSIFYSANNNNNNNNTLLTYLLHCAESFLRS